MNPFDQSNNDDAVHEYAARIVKNPFTDADELSPISVAVNTEAMRQAELLFRGAYDDVNLSRTHSRLPTFVTASSFSNEDLPAQVTVSAPHDADTVLAIETLMASSPFGTNAMRVGSTISRSKTDGRLDARPRTSVGVSTGGASLSPSTYLIVRAASAKSVMARRTSSRFEKSNTPSDDALRVGMRGDGTVSGGDSYEDNLTRTVSSRSISSRAGAIAVGDDEEIGLVKSRSEHYIGNHIAQKYITPPGSARGNITPIGDAAYNERCECIFQLIKTKFLKHVRCEPCDESHTCMCTRDCEASADVFSERYGRLHNRMHIKPGYYAIGHLVDLFIDAYDEEKRMRDIDRSYA